MPQNIAVEIELTNFADDDSFGEKMHGLLFNLLSQNQEIAMRHHQPNTRKLFTISDIYGDERPWVRIAALDDKLGQIILKSIIEKIETGDAMRIGKHPFLFKQLLFSAQYMSKNTFSKTFNEHLIKASEREEVCLQFLSPTTFNFGKISYPLPDPYLVFKNYLRNWTLADGHMIEDLLANILLGANNVTDDMGSGKTVEKKRKEAVELFLTIIKNKAAISRHDIKSRLLRFRDHDQVGFLGKVTFQFKGFEPRLIKILNALADFAFFCGTGYKTTMGMGQTIRIK